MVKTLVTPGADMNDIWTQTILKLGELENTMQHTREVDVILDLIDRAIERVESGDSDAKGAIVSELYTLHLFIEVMTGEAKIVKGGETYSIKELGIEPKERQQ